MNMTFKVSGFAVLLFALAGCANQTDNGAALSVSPSATATSTDIPVCLSNQLTIILGQDGVAMGHFGIDSSAFKNISNTTCTLKGYPNFQMLGDAGKHIATHVIDGTSYTVQVQPEDVVILDPGNQANFDLGFDNSTGYGNAICPTSAQVEITPPGSIQPIVVPWKFQPYGGGTIPKLRCGEITVSPVYWPIRA